MLYSGIKEAKFSSSSENTILIPGTNEKVTVPRSVFQIHQILQDEKLSTAEAKIDMISFSTDEYCTKSQAENSGLFASLSNALMSSTRTVKTQACIDAAAELSIDEDIAEKPEKPPTSGFGNNL